MSQPVMVYLPAAEIATYADGDAGRPWIVISNSLGATHAMWEPQLDLLTKHYRVLRYDTRGHGKSSAPPAPYALDELTGDVLGILDHHGIETADMIGLSLGGTTMMRFATAHPERVKKLVICDASAETEPADLDRWDRRIAQVTAQGTPSLGDELLGRWYTPAFREARPDAMAWSLEMLAEVSATGYAGCAAALKNIHLTQGLRSLKRETLYISGMQDGQTPVKMAQLADITPSARFHGIDPGAHFPNVESPDQFQHGAERLPQPLTGCRLPAGQREFPIREPGQQQDLHLPVPAGKDRHADQQHDEAERLLDRPGIRLEPAQAFGEIAPAEHDRPLSGSPYRARKPMSRE